MQFRKDINGLRAIAVIAVVLFHFNASWMPGGFAGVDVFFVISGFLMTGIIFRGMEQGDFSILKFYVGRANRIIPALALLCLVLLIFGWFYLAPLDYIQLAKHVVSSLGFLSNITYWHESGYFDAASHEKWLLHTWSLSAEWQFYMIYPIVLVVMRKLLSVKAMKAAIILATILGFIFCVVATYKWPTPAYYLLPTRAWEMMIGGVAYLCPLAIKDKRKRIVEWLGLIIIVGTYLLISKENAWPGYLAVFPVLGTFLVILAQRNDSIITNNVIFQKIGTWSYSIYLWHWPLVVAIYYYSLSQVFVYIGIILSILFGFFSHKYVERIKFTHDFRNLFGYLKCKPIYMALCISLLGFIVELNTGFISRYDHVENIDKLEKNRVSAEDYYRKNLMKEFSNRGESYDNSFLCTLDGHKQNIATALACLNHKLGQSGYLVIGDSHGRDFLHALMLSYPNVNFAMLHQSSCVPSKYSDKKDCFAILDEIRIKLILGNKKVKGVFFSSLYADDKGVNSLIGDIHEGIYGDVPLFVVNANPTIKKSIVDLSIRNSRITDYYDLSFGVNRQAVAVNDKLLLLKSVNFFDKYSVFCKGYNCQLNEGLEPYFWDSGHLSWLGIKKVSDSISTMDLLGTIKIK